MLQIGNMLAHVAQFGVPEHQLAVLDMGTHNAARAIGMHDTYGLKVGRQADLIVLDTFKVADALVDALLAGYSAYLAQKSSSS